MAVRGLGIGSCSHGLSHELPLGCIGCTQAAVVVHFLPAQILTAGPGLLDLTDQAQHINMMAMWHCTVNVPELMECWYISLAEVIETANGLLTMQSVISADFSSMDGSLPTGPSSADQQAAGSSSMSSSASSATTTTSDDNTTFLRGITPTDSNGIAVFQTIFPGWYSGRATHIHAKVGC